MEVPHYNHPMGKLGDCNLATSLRYSLDLFLKTTNSLLRFLAWVFLFREQGYWLFSSPTVNLFSALSSSLINNTCSYCLTLFRQTTGVLVFTLAIFTINGKVSGSIACSLTLPYQAWTSICLRIGESTSHSFEFYGVLPH